MLLWLVASESAAWTIADASDVVDQIDYDAAQQLAVAADGSNLPVADSAESPAPFLPRVLSVACALLLVQLMPEVAVLVD